MLDAILQIESLPPLPIASCVLAGLAAGVALYTLLSLAPKVPASLQGINYELELRARLCAEDGVYRHFGLLVEELAGLLRSTFLSESQLRELNHALDICGKAPPWRAEQYVANKLVEGAMAGVAIGLLSLVISKSLVGAALVLLLVAVCYAGFSVYSLREQAAVRAQQVRGRMAFATDLMALVMQAGGTPADAFEAVVRENAGHPLGEEFGFVAQQTKMGRLRAEALKGFRDRFPDPDIKDFVFAVLKGEELGTPLAVVLNMQSQQMRLKHSQWCEKQAEEAGVKMTFPSMLVMLACICVILGPLLLPVVFSTGGMF